MKKPESKYEKLRKLRRRFGNMPSNRYDKIKDREIKKLQDAVAKFCANLGGDVAVIGPAQIWHWPSDASMNFHIAMKCTGTEPPFVNRKQGME